MSSPLVNPCPCQALEVTWSSSENLFDAHKVLQLLFPGQFDFRILTPEEVKYCFKAFKDAQTTLLQKILTFHFKKIPLPLIYFFFVLTILKQYFWSTIDPTKTIGMDCLKLENIYGTNFNAWHCKVILWMWLRLKPAHKNIKFQNLRIECGMYSILASFYVGRDPQGGTSDGSFFNKFSFKLQSMVKDLLLVL